MLGVLKCDETIMEVEMSTIFGVKVGQIVNRAEFCRHWHSEQRTI